MSALAPTERPSPAEAAGAIPPASGGPIADGPVAGAFKLRVNGTGFVNVLLGLVVGAGLLVFVARQVDLAAVGRILGNASVPPLLLALAIFGAVFLIRAVRFWAILESSSGARLPLLRCINPFIASFGLNDVLPLRLGDGFRVVWFSRRFGLPIATVLGALLLERILDLASLLAIAAVTIGLAGLSLPPAILFAFQIGAAMAVLAVAAVLVAPRFAIGRLSRLAAGLRWRPLRHGLEQAIATAEAVHAAGRGAGNLALLAGLSLLSWFLESLVFYAAWISLGGAASQFVTTLLAYLASMLGTLVPGPPGHVGTFHYFGLQTLVAAGVDASFSASVVVLAHLLLWLPTAFYAGAWFLARTLGALWRRAPGRTVVGCEAEG